MSAIRCHGDQSVAAAPSIARTRRSPISLRQRLAATQHAAGVIEVHHMRIWRWAEEIFEPCEESPTRKDKFKQYIKAGVKCYWIADPKLRTLEGFKLVGGRYRSTGKGKNSALLRLPPFDDLEIPLADLWQPK